VHLRQTGLPLVLSDAGDIERLIALTSPLEPTTVGGARVLKELGRDLYGFIEATGGDLTYRQQSGATFDLSLVRPRSRT
jgi:hypothetical protein